MSKNLKILFVVVLFKQLLWASFIPIWQFPDEQAHFGQVQNQAEGNPINPARANNTSREIDESEILLGTKRDVFGNNKFTYHPEFKLEFTDSVYGKEEEKIKGFPLSFRKEFVSNEATSYPPLYYQLAALFYNTFNNSDLFTRLYFTRLFNIVLFLTLMLLTYLIAQLIFPFNQILQITLVILVVFHPMLSFVAGGINSDNLFNLLFTVGIYLNLRILKIGWNLKLVVLTLLTFYLINLTKPQGQLIIFLYAFPVGLSIIRKRSFFPLIFVLFLVFLFLRNNILNLMHKQQFLPEISADILPKAFSLTNYLSYLKFTMIKIYRETLPWYWGVFRWLSLTYPRIVHRIINWTLVSSFFGILFYFYEKLNRRKKSFDLKYFLFLIYTSFIYSLALITYDYLFATTHGFSLGLQGRYFSPFITALMAVILIGLNSLISLFKINQNFIKLVGVGMLVLHSYAFIFVAKSYIGASTLKLIFIQLSQYKPYFFKSPYLEFFLLINLISLCYFLWYYLRMEQDNASS